MTDLWPDVRPEAARRLMAAAVAAFGERGYHATTTRDIATAAGMSPAALYVHFPSKAAVLAAISRSGHEKALAMVTAAASGPGDPPARMRALVTEFTAWHARRHQVARIVQYELSALPQPDHDLVVGLRRQTDAVVRSLIEEGVASGDFHVADVRSAARAVLSLGIDVARWYTPDTRPDPDALGAEYASLVLAMLGVRR
ncbi:TetR/AcrR family transcriptional regulator [Actinokineospora sp. NPDC004072]